MAVNPQSGRGILMGTSNRVNLYDRLPALDLLEDN
jgi:hypothetical protein